MTSFEIPLHWRIPTEAMRYSFVEMAQDGVRGNEGIAMWLGNRAGHTVTVTHVVRLNGPGIQKGPDRLFISPDLVNELTDITIGLQRSLVGQIHSHGQFHGTHLSETDRRYGITFPGYLSLVAPNYAQDPHTEIEDCGVHVFDPALGWKRLNRQEVQTSISIVTDSPVAVITAG